MNSIKTLTMLSQNVYLIIILAFSVIGKVVGCQIGYYGVNCTAVCKHPSFGEQCQGKCNCTEDVCNHITGCKNYQNVECDDGYYGQNCDFPCRYPNYGKLCQKMCDCSKMKCDHVYGCGNIFVTGNETSLMDKSIKAVIIGSCTSSMILTMIVCLIVKAYRYKHKSKRERTEKDNQQSSYITSQSDRNTSRTSYTGLESYESIDVEEYQNAPNTSF